MSPSWALVASFLAAGCFGIAAVLQRSGAAGLADHPAHGLGLLGRLLSRPAFLGGLLFDGAGVLASVAAVRALPMHVVESILASSVAVAAVLSAALLGERLGRQRVLALVALAAALVAVTLTATEHAASALHGPATLAPLALLPLACAAARACRRLPRASRGFASGALSGLGFGVLALSGQLLPAPGGVVDAGDVVFVATVGLWLCFGIGTFGAGVRDEEVTPVIVGQTLGEAVLPSVVGLLLGGDVLAGAVLLPAAAFLVAIAAAVVVARAAHGSSPPGSVTPAAAERTARHAAPQTTVVVLAVV